MNKFTMLTPFLFLFLFWKENLERHIFLKRYYFFWKEFQRGKNILFGNTLYLNTFFWVLLKEENKTFFSESIFQYGKNILLKEHFFFLTFFEFLKEKGKTFCFESFLEKDIFLRKAFLLEKFLKGKSLF